MQPNPSKFPGLQRWISKRGEDGYEYDYESEESFTTTKAKERSESE